MAEIFVPGQRWLSNNEPELGLGLVITAARGRVSILFPASGQTRQYTTASAPLTRIRFSEGDEVRGHDGTVFIVESVSEEKGLLGYHAPGHNLTESALADSLNFTNPIDRLLNAQIDDKGLFNLRSKALHHRFETLRGHQRGFVGPRIELIPHQLFAALQIRRKGIPRLVLADESGIGKTIESCLVLHRLLVTNRIERALVVVPTEGFSRWHFELTRRFHLPVTAHSGKAGSGDFPAESNLVLITPASLDAAALTNWDILLVDDAETIDCPALVQLCTETPGVVLMTDLPPATEPEAHAHLRQLVDGGQGAIVSEPATVAFAEKLLAATPEPWPDEERLALEALVGAEIDPVTFTADNPEGRERLLAALLEAIGAGRRLLRNSRTTIEGLPEREALPEKLTAADDALRARLAAEFLPGGQPNPAFAVPPDDPRLAWLISYVEANPRDKIVLLCSTKEKAAIIAGGLGEKASLHHEGLDLAARDVALQRFSEKDERAAFVLVCSEFGIEARSIPFAHHLVLFDLPPDPLRVQKRIGALDRFGHMAKVRVHIPYVEGTPAEVIFRWFHEALHLFERPLPVVHACGRAFAEKFSAVAQLPPAEATEALGPLLIEAQHHADELKAKLESGRDRLTDLASYRYLPAHRLLESVRRLDSDLSLDFLMLRLFDHFGFDAEDVGERTYNVKPREKDRDAAAFPEIITGVGQLMTFERQKALARDDLRFVTWDSPTVMDHIALLLRGTQGNSCYAVWEDLRSQILLLEALFRVELVTWPKKLYPTRFFSPAGVRLLVNHEGEDVGAEYPMELINKNVRNGRREWIRSNHPALKRLLPQMLDQLTQRAHTRAAEMSAQALADLNTQLVPELERLKLLQERGGPATNLEIQLLEAEILTLHEILSKPTVRLDSLRLVRRGPAGKGI